MWVSIIILFIHSRPVLRTRIIYQTYSIIHYTSCIHVECSHFTRAVTWRILRALHCIIMITRPKTFRDEPKTDRHESSVFQTHALYVPGYDRHDDQNVSQSVIREKLGRKVAAVVSAPITCPKVADSGIVHCSELCLFTL